MKEQVRLDGLLFSTDAQVLRVMNQVLDSFAIQTEVCTEVGYALEAVTHRRLDTVIVDWNAANNPARVVRTFTNAEEVKAYIESQQQGAGPADALCSNGVINEKS